MPRDKKPTVVILKTKKPPTLKKLKNKAPKVVVVVVKEKEVDILKNRRCRIIVLPQRFK